MPLRSGVTNILTSRRQLIGFGDGYSFCGGLTVQREVVRSPGFQPGFAAIAMQAGCLRYMFVATIRCTAKKYEENAMVE